MKMAKEDDYMTSDHQNSLLPDFQRRQSFYLPHFDGHPMVLEG